MTLPERSIPLPPPPTGHEIRLLPGGAMGRACVDPLKRNALSPYALGGKRVLGLFLLLPTVPPALLLGLPIALINLAIFRDPRRILFRQPRVGRGGRVFSIWKFRTMREVQADDFDSWREGRDRLRVTPFGRLLRNTHLDELPQLWNVLRGEMDLVGPRPEMVEIHEWAAAAIPGFERRCAVRPGITGLAQITQGYTGMDERAYRHKLAADLQYLRSLSLGRDLAILARTVLWMLEGRGWIPRGEVPRARLLGGKGATLPAGSPARIDPWVPPVSSRTMPSKSTTRAPATPSGRPG